MNTIKPIFRTIKCFVLFLLYCAKILCDTFKGIFNKYNIDYYNIIYRYNTIMSIIHTHVVPNL